MKQVPLTIRIDAQTHEQYKFISKELGVPMSKVIRSALHSYVPQALEEIEANLQTRLQRLRAYRRQDPDFSQATERILEGNQGGHDPLDGEICTEEEWNAQKDQDGGNEVDETFSFA